MKSSFASLDPAQRGELLRVLFHHLGGGMHNAALALELVAPDAVDEPRSSTEARALA